MVKVSSNFKFNCQYPILPGTFNKPLDNQKKLDVQHFIEVLESMCGGTIESEDVESFQGNQKVTKEFVKLFQSRVGQIQWNTNLRDIYENPGSVKGLRWGSGTLISDSLFLTAGHTFDQHAQGHKIPRNNNTNEKIPPKEIASNMHINFNYQYDIHGDLREVSRHDILELIEYRVEHLDYSIVKVAGNPGKTFGYTEISTTDPSVGDVLTIIGHPEGVPKRITFGTATAILDDIITYNDLDTVFGDSGSGILNLKGKIIGVHTNGGCDNEAIGHNSGLRMPVIRDVSPTIRSLI